MPDSARPAGSAVKEQTSRYSQPPCCCVPNNSVPRAKLTNGRLNREQRQGIHVSGNTDASWIAVDWGTTRLRAWSLDPECRVLNAASSEAGMNTLAPENYEAALLDLVDAWLAPERETLTIVCGMAGAKGGWLEAPYLAVPCFPDSLSRVYPHVKDPRISVCILPGLMQAEPADVMRGEETQIAGFLSCEPDYDGLICLPGTHTKWVRVRQRSIVSFQTFMTGELFSLLSRRSVLRHSMSDDEWDTGVFIKGVSEALCNADRFPAALFPLRARTLVSTSKTGSACAHLSGLLIGGELMACDALSENLPIVIVGDSGLSGHYASALSVFRNISCREEYAEQMTISGLYESYLRIAGAV